MYFTRHKSPPLGLCEPECIVLSRDIVFKETVFEPGQIANALDRAVAQFSCGTEVSLSIDLTRRQRDGCSVTERVSTRDLLTQAHLADVTVELNGPWKSGWLKLGA
jgi:hypothetical protein